MDHINHRPFFSLVQHDLASVDKEHKQPSLLLSFLKRPCLAKNLNGKTYLTCAEGFSEFDRLNKLLLRSKTWNITPVKRKSSSLEVLATVIDFNTQDQSGSSTDEACSHYTVPSSEVLRHCRALMGGTPTTPLLQGVDSDSRERACDNGVRCVPSVFIQAAQRPTSRNKDLASHRSNMQTGQADNRLSAAGYFKKSASGGSAALLPSTEEQDVEESASQPEVS